MELYDVLLLVWTSMILLFSEEHFVRFCLVVHCCNLQFKIIKHWINQKLVCIISTLRVFCLERHNCVILIYIPN